MPCRSEHEHSTCAVGLVWICLVDRQKKPFHRLRSDLAKSLRCVCCSTFFPVLFVHLSTETECDYLNGWINGHIRKNLTQNAEPQSRGTLKKNEFACFLRFFFLFFFFTPFFSFPSFFHPFYLFLLLHFLFFQSFLFYLFLFPFLSLYRVLRVQFVL